MTAAILVATGTQREAATLRASDVIVIAGGGAAARLRAQLEAAAPRAAAILSYGMCGALAADLAIGDWVVGDRLTGGSEAGCDPAWRDALAGVLGARAGVIHADGRMIDDVAEKAALARGGAIAVDMESHVAAEVAAAHGLPFGIVRCVSDRADQALPPAIRVAMRPDGGLAVGSMLASLAARPGQAAHLVGTLAGFARAMRALSAGGRALAPRLANGLS